MDSKTFAESICKLLVEHKAEDVIMLDVKEKSGIADYFVVCSGRSMTHTRALIEFIEDEMEKQGVAPIREEGAKEGRWAVVDYGDVICHVFNDETRLFYHLEKLWDDGKNITKF